MNVAIFWPNWVGDAVMATPAVRALRNHLRGARFIGVLKPYIAGVVAGSPWHDDLVLLGVHRAVGREMGSVGRLRQERIDLAVLFPNSFRTAWLAWLGRCCKRIGYRRYGRSLLLTDGLQPLRDRSGRLVPSPVIDAYNRLATHVGCVDPGYDMELFTTRQDEAAADQVWQQAGILPNSEVICLNPGAAFGSAKYWPVESFAQLARHWVRERGSHVLVLCGPGEEELARQIVERADEPNVHSLAGQPLSLGLTKACVRRADLLVTTDSGPRHFAAAFRRPVVTLFGPTHITWTETYYARAVHLQKRVECGPCQRRVCPLDHRCMTLLTPTEVFRAATALLERVRSTAARTA